MTRSLRTLLRRAAPAIALLACPTAEADPVLHAPIDLPVGRPDAIVDLASTAGADRVQATWRYADATLAEAEGHEPGPDL